ncbi:MAG: class I SAM-dependent methyltransferase [Nanoarchaeota archaeon]|nr:class I SAM-dependent methyltransferase [Nanoarchaeota archaeon]
MVLSKHPQDIKNIKKRASDAISLLDGLDKSKVLELGTGIGEFLLELTEKGFDVIGIDIIPNKKLIKKGFDIRKHDLNGGLPFEDSSFDVVVALEVLEHLCNPYKMMKEIKRVLRDGGYAIISMPNTASIFQRIGQLYEKRMDNLDIYWHHYQPSIISIRNLVSTELKIEKEIFSFSFRRLRGFDWLGKILLKINKEAFTGCFMLKARKIKK